MTTLINRNFLLLWTGQLVSQLGDKIYSIALAWWLLERTNSPSMMGFFLVTSMLPELILGPLVGPLIDRWNRKSILVSADILRGTVVSLIAFLSHLGILETWQIFGAALLISVSSAFFNPTVMAVIPQIVEKDELAQANSLSQITNGVSTVLGPLLGAATVSWLGYSVVFLLNGLSYLIAAALALFLKIIKLAEETKQENFLTSLQEGFQFIRSNHQVLLILLVIALVHVFFGSLLVTLPFLANSLSGRGINNLGCLEATLGLGLILGSLLISQKKSQSLKSSDLFLAVLALGFCFTTLGIIQSLRIEQIFSYLVITLLIGIAVTITSIYWRSLLQTAVPNELGGRVFSIASTIADTSLPLAIGISGLLLSHCSVHLLLLVSGICLIIIGASLVIVPSSTKHFAS